MKKLTTLALFCVLAWGFCVPSAFAGPFGIDMGMSLAQVTAVCKTTPKHIGDGTYRITPPKTHDIFESYSVMIDPDYGVYMIMAISSEIQTNNHGRELIRTFDNLVASIERTYGSYEIIDENNGYFGDKPDYFMFALQKGDRELKALWGAKFESTLPNDIMGIMVYPQAMSTSSGIVLLSYISPNFVKVQEKSDTVF